MNLLTILKGDYPGHPFRGNQYGPGTGESTGGTASIMLAHLHDAEGKYLPDAGFTMDARTKTDVTSGIAVDPFPHRSLELAITSMSKEQIKSRMGSWLKKNRTMLADKRIKIGGWIDPKTMHAWIGCTRVYSPSDKDLAIAIGRKANQISVADLAAVHRGDWDNAFIQTGGNGTVTKSDMTPTPGGNHHVLFMLDNDASLDDIMQALMDNLPEGTFDSDLTQKGAPLGNQNAAGPHTSRSNAAAANSLNAIMPSLKDLGREDKSRAINGHMAHRGYLHLGSSEGIHVFRPVTGEKMSVTYNTKNHTADSHPHVHTLKGNSMFKTLLKGDTPGHEFHGNQWTAASGGAGVLRALKLPV